MNIPNACTCSLKLTIFSSSVSFLGQRCWKICTDRGSITTWRHFTHNNLTDSHHCGVHRRHLFWPLYHDHPHDLQVGWRLLHNGQLLSRLKHNQTLHQFKNCIRHFVILHLFGVVMSICVQLTLKVTHTHTHTHTHTPKTNKQTTTKNTTYFN